MISCLNGEITPRVGPLAYNLLRMNERGPKLPNRWIQRPGPLFLSGRYALFAIQPCPASIAGGEGEMARRPGQKAVRKFTTCKVTWFSGTPAAWRLPEVGKQLVFHELQVQGGPTWRLILHCNLARPVWIPLPRECILSEMITFPRLDKIDYT